MLKYCFLCIVLENGRYLPLIIWLDNLSSVLRIFLALKEKPIKRSCFNMSYTLLVWGHNCIIAGDFIKKAYGYCRTVCMMCRLYFLYVLYIMCVLYTLYILCILDLKNMTAYNIEKKKIRYKKTLFTQGYQPIK